jgi:hypothetical protein
MVDLILSSGWGKSVGLKYPRLYGHVFNTFLDPACEELAMENHFTNKASKVTNSPSVSIRTANSTEFKSLLGRSKDQFSFQEMVSQIYRHDFLREILWSGIVVSVLCSTKPLINFTPCCISIIKSVERSPISPPIDLKRFYLGLFLFSQYISCHLISYVFKSGPFTPPSEPMT